MSTSPLTSLARAALFSGLGFFGALQTATAQAPAISPPASDKPINLSRLFGGATIQLIDAKTGRPMQVAGMSAAIDDNTSSGWTPPVGKSLVLISFPGDETFNSFSLFAPGMKGRYAVSAAASLEGALNPRSRTSLLSSEFGDNPTQPMAGVKARFIVLELDITESVPLRSIDMIGRPDTSAGRLQVVVTPETGAQNDGTTKGQIAEVNFATSELGGRVITGGESYDNLIDGDTGTSGQLAVTDGKSSTTLITLGAVVDIDRITLAFSEAKGTVSFWSTQSAPPDGRQLGQAVLDGTRNTLTLETPGISTRSLAIVWTPADGKSPLTVYEVGAFALARVVTTLPPISSSADPIVRPPPPPPILPPSKPVSG